MQFVLKNVVNKWFCFSHQEEYKSRVLMGLKIENQNMKKLNPVMLLMETLSDEFPPLLELKKIWKRVMENVETYVKMKEAIFDAKAEDIEQKLEEIRNFIRVQEKHWNHVCPQLLQTISAKRNVFLTLTTLDLESMFLQNY